MKSPHDVNPKWFWRENAMFNEGARKIEKALNKRHRRRELKQRDREARFE